MADTEKHRVGNKASASALAKVESEQQFEQLLGAMSSGSMGCPLTLKGGHKKKSEQRGEVGIKTT
eukprot:2201024-Lingulodinium_polyedra.AAC.1